MTSAVTAYDVTLRVRYSGESTRRRDGSNSTESVVTSRLRLAPPIGARPTPSATSNSGGRRCRGLIAGLRSYGWQLRRRSDMRSTTLSI